MDTNVLISRVAQLYNQAAQARGAGNEAEARANLVKLCKLLNAELAPEVGGDNHPPETDELPES